MHLKAGRIALLLGLLLGCGPKTPPPSAAPATPPVRAVISAATGGTLGDAAGAQLTVPPGALSKDATIILEKKSPEAFANSEVRVVGPIWNLQVDGAEHFRFSKPVKIELPVDPALRTSGSTVGMSVWNGDRWQRVSGARLDPSTGKVVAEVRHFSAHAPTQSPSPDPVKRAGDDRLNGILNNEYWYGRVVVEIRGSAARKREGGEQHYAIQREAVVTFRMKANPGEVGMISAMEQMKKSGASLPPEAIKQMKDLLERRHWMSEIQKPEKEDITDVHIRVQDTSGASSPKVELGELREEATWSKQSLKGGLDTQLSKCANMLEIDVAKGTYSFGLGGVSGGEVEYHAEQFDGEKGPQFDGEKGRDSLTRVDSKAPTGVEVKLKDLKLPDGGGLLTGTRRIPRNQLQYFIRGILGNWEFRFGRVRGLISWTFSPVPFDDVELVLAPKDYDDWLPRAGSAEGEKGKPLAIQVRLQGRGGAATKARMTRLSVRLQEVSNEFGICLNVPQQKGADTPDLRFAPGAGYTVEGEGSTVLKKGSEFDKVDLTLDCYDWGAWGTIVAEAVLADGRMVWGTLEGDPAEDELRVPKRDPEFHIADKWKKEMKVDDAADSDDADPQKGNGNHGDGLTAYEEYRGMMVKGKHTRDLPPGPDGFRPLSPRRKDIIVANTIGQVPSVISGFRLLEKAAGIHVVEVDAGDLPDSRVVNVNRKDQAPARAQRGLVLYNEKLNPGTTGLTPADLTKPAGSRERYNRVQVDLDQIRQFHRTNSADGFSADAEIAQTVAHELAHGLDLVHHGEDGRTLQLQDPSRLAIYDRSRNKIALTTIPGIVGEPGNEACGNVQCIMCYTTMYTWSYQAPSFLFAAELPKLGSIFCTTKDGTGHNAPFVIDDPQKPGRKLNIQGVFGKALYGPCLPKMRIKDQN